MEHKTQKNSDNGPVLPVLASSPADLGRLIRELETIDHALLQLRLRSNGQDIKLPKTSQLMDEIVELNKLNLLHAEHREALKKFLTDVRQNAPVIHMSFGADPDVAFIEKVMVWLRREIHPLVLLTIGLQPNLGAGCVMRTTNKYFDFSLRQNFVKKREILLAKLMPEIAKSGVMPEEVKA